MFSSPFWKGPWILLLSELNQLHLSFQKEIFDLSPIPHWRLSLKIWQTFPIPFHKWDPELKALKVLFDFQYLSLITLTARLLSKFSNLHHCLSIWTLFRFLAHLIPKPPSSPSLEILSHPTRSIPLSPSPFPQRNFAISEFRFWRVVSGSIIHCIM